MENNIIRKPTDKELILLKSLAAHASYSIEEEIINNLLVSTMNDGGMGSLILYPHGFSNGSRKFGKNISSCEFVDKDGTPVSSCLFLDKNNELFELDIFKGDGSPLIEIPNESDFIFISDIE